MTHQYTLPFTDDKKATPATKAKQILEMLQAGPVTRNELAKVTDRFSASIHKLRDMGHVIDITAVDGGSDVYRWLSYTPMIEVTEEMKQAYYATSHWRDIRRERKELDDWKCCHCRSITDIQVHHWVYDLFNEDLTDLSTLCGSCHDKIHANENITIHFPHYVTPEIARRITGT